MGDFNASQNNISSAIKYKLLQFLQFNNMYNLAEHTQSSLPTWQSSRYQSTINYIWAHNPILRYLSKFETDQSNSDHTILISKWSFPYALFKTRRYSTKTHRNVFDYKSMNSK